MIQNYTHYFKLQPLEGIEEIKQKPSFSIKNYYNRKYQNQIDEYIKQHFGFRETAIRFYNQFMFDFYKNTTNKSIIIGKNNTLYESSHIHNYLNSKDPNNPVTYDKQNTDKKINNIKQISQLLKSQGIEFIFAIYPSKAYVYPENIPDNLKNKKGKQFNPYNDFIKQKNDSINIIDFNRWFIELAKKSDIKLFPPTGTHWQTFAAMKAADSLIHLMEKIKHIDIPKIYLDSIYTTTDYKKVDKDLEQLLNLQRKIKKPTTTYAKPYYETSSGKTKPKVIIISDSYWWNIYDNIQLDSIFSEHQYWYYFKTVYKYEKKEIPINEINIRKEIQNTDFVILLTSPVQLGSYGWGFDEEIKKIFDKNYATQKLHLIDSIKNIIKTSPDWFEQVKQKALEQKITLDSMLNKDAEWILDNN